MNDEEFEFLDDVSEHANLPKVLINSPKLLDQKSPILKYNKIINGSAYNQTKKQKEIKDRILLNNDLKLSLRIEDKHKNNINNPLLKIDKNDNSSSRKTLLTKSQRIDFSNKLKNSVVNNIPILQNGKNGKNKNKSGTHIIYVKTNLNDEEINSDLKRSFQQKLKYPNKKIVIKREHKQKIKEQIKNKQNSLDSKKNNNQNKIFKQININNNGKKEKNEKSISPNNILRPRKKKIIVTNDSNLVRKEINKIFDKTEEKSILDLNGQELSKLYIKRSNKRLKTHINSIRCFCSNSSQNLFNKEKINNSKNEDVSIKKDVLNFKKDIQNSRNTIETNRDFNHKLIKNKNFKLILDSNFRTYDPNKHREKNNFINRSKTYTITIKNPNLLIHNAKFQLNENIKLEKKDNLDNSKLKEEKYFNFDENNNDINEDIMNNKSTIKEIIYDNKNNDLNEKENNNDEKKENLNFIEQQEEIDFLKTRRLTLPPQLINENNNDEKNNDDIKKSEKDENNINDPKENNLLINNNEKDKSISLSEEKLKPKEELEDIDILKLFKNNSKNNLELNHKLEMKHKIEKNNERLNNEKSPNHVKRRAKINEYISHYAISKAGKDEYGNSKTNQDTYIVLTDINGLKDFNIFGVLDGHGPEGHYVSQFISNYIKEHFQSNPLFDKMKNTEKIYEKLSSRNFKIIKDIFINADNALMDEDINSNQSGTTCVLVIHIGEHIICANTGDSRAILIFDEKNDDNLDYIKVFPLSFDSKPENPEEKIRICNMGGMVSQIINKRGHGVGPYRVWVKNKDYPGLAMSRSLGDFNARNIGVIPDPEIIECKLSIYSKYIVICSDGVWEFLGNEDVMKLGRKFYLENNPREFCKKLFDKSAKFWKKEDDVIDDITIVTIFF